MGGSCKVVDVDVVEVEVVVEEVVVPGPVTSVVVEVEAEAADVEAVVTRVVVVGSPVIRTTGGCTVIATIDSSSRIWSAGVLDSRATQDVTDALVHDAGWVTHLEAGRRSRPLVRGNEDTKLP
jgi:hypothetical protein